MTACHQQCGRYLFDFTPSGLFTLVNKEGDALYDLSLPYFEKSFSHLVWIFFWSALILFSYLFKHNWHYWTDRLFMALLIVHLFFLGCRLTTLLLMGGLRPILFPPLWIKLTRRLQKGAGIELLKKHQLHTHPGLLTNLALIHYSRGELHKAHTTIQEAMHYSNHPILTAILSHLNQKTD